MSKSQGAFVLENRAGQVVRTFNWDSQVLTMVYRKDTRRVEAVPNTIALDKEKIPYLELAEVSKGEVQKKAVKLGNAGTLRWVESVEMTSPSVTTPEESEKPFWLALKATGGTAALLLLLVMLVAHFFGPKSAEEQKEEMQVVKIMPRPQKIVEPMKEHHKVTHIAEHKHVVKKSVPKIAQLKAPRKVAPANAKHKVMALNQMGALGVFGSLDNAHATHGGINLNNIQTSKGPGLGGTQGSGGMQTSLYAKGLVSAPVGPGARAEGAGGYGTHGKGGGQAGYGQLSMIGSSNSYFEPIERDAEVEGGLDREQIAAVIQRHIGQIRYCYEQGLQVTPGLAGRVAIHFLIGGTGTVKTADVANTSLHSQDVESCITGRLKSWKFPEPRGGVVVKVTYPFVLKRVSQS